MGQIDVLPLLGRLPLGLFLAIHSTSAAIERAFAEWRRGIPPTPFSGDSATSIIQTPLHLSTPGQNAAGSAIANWFLTEDCNGRYFLAHDIQHE